MPINRNYIKNLGRNAESLLDETVNLAGAGGNASRHSTGSFKHWSRQAGKHHSNDGATLPKPDRIPGHGGAGTVDKHTTLDTGRSSGTGSSPYNTSARNMPPSKDYSKPDPVSSSVENVAPNRESEALKKGQFRSKSGKLLNAKRGTAVPVRKGQSRGGALFRQGARNFDKNGGWARLGVSAVRGGMVGGLAGGTYEAATGGDFWDGATSGAIYGSLGASARRGARSFTNAKAKQGVWNAAGQMKKQYYPQGVSKQAEAMMRQRQAAAAAAQLNNLNK